MKIQHIRKNTIRHRKNSEWLQCSGNSEKPENDTKIKILKISKNYHKPSLPQGLERFSKVTPCNEKCNFFILLQNVPLFFSSVGGDSDPRSYISSVGGDSDPRSYISSVGGECLNGIHTVEILVFRSPSPVPIEN